MSFFFHADTTNSDFDLFKLGFHSLIRDIKRDTAGERILKRYYRARYSAAKAQNVELDQLVSYFDEVKLPIIDLRVHLVLQEVRASVESQKLIPGYLLPASHHLAMAPYSVLTLWEVFMGICPFCTSALTTSARL